MTHEEDAAVSTGRLRNAGAGSFTLRAYGAGHSRKEETPTPI
jgi:hypothetical protein